jgi:surface polysaccharide O-acyltransferase-like enzyme
MSSLSRLYYIDVLRILATTMVVMIHTSGMLMQNTEVGSNDYWVGFCNFEIVRSAVPLFFMISGTLLLNPQYHTNPKKMLDKVLKVVIIMLIWSFVYAIFTCESLSIKCLLYQTIKGPFHFWFFEFLIGLYLLTPIFKAIVSYKDGTLIKYYLVLFLCFGIIVPSLQAIDFCHKWVMDVTSKVNIELMGFSGYFFMGYYLSEKSFKVPTSLIILIFILSIILQGLITYNTNLLYSSDKWWIMTFLQCSCIFVIIKKLCYANGGVLLTLSSLTMGVFILHPLFLWIVPKNLWTLEWYVLDVLFVLIGSFLISFIISKIPYIGKKLISL